MPAKKQPTDKSKKRKYEKPKINRHGTLQSIAERVTGLVALCCLSRRAERARRSTAEKERLADDIARGLQAV